MNADHPLPIEEEQTISQPYIVAYMTEALELTPGGRVLEIGTGSGYAAAVLSRIVKTVYTAETAGSASRTTRPGGRLVIPIGPTSFLQMLIRVSRVRGKFLSEGMELAEKVQQLLLPKNSPTCNWCRSGVKNRTAAGLGGDYFDIINMPDECQSLFIGDVTGHGLHASVVMSLIYGVIDPRTFAMHYVNAGQVPALVLHDGRVEELHSGEGGKGARTADIPGVIGKCAAILTFDGRVICQLLHQLGVIRRR